MTHSLVLFLLGLATWLHPSIVVLREAGGEWEDIEVWLSLQSVERLQMFNAMRVSGLMLLGAALAGAV